MSTEFELIDLIAKRACDEPSVIVGIGDDGCVLQTSPGSELVVTTDTLVIGQHFRQDWLAHEVGYLAMAVNLSDLAAMGATPKWALLSLTLPKESDYTSPAWLNGFLDGFLSHRHGPVLVGGNFSSGPLSITVQLIGEVPRGQALTRGGSCVGDLLVVSGTLGDAAGALRVSDDALERRLRHPTPQHEHAASLRSRVHSVIDISDGLLADLRHLLAHDMCGDQQRKPLGALIELAHLPTSEALMRCFPEHAQRWPLQLSGGSDYELLMTVPEPLWDELKSECKIHGMTLTCIGQVTDTGDIELRQADGHLFSQTREGWDHFAISQ